MKALRRSIKGEKDTKHQHASIGHKSAIAIVPPKKVIRALYDYEARSAQELSFSRGDFFHVIGRENDSDWYEACNPALPHARGLVPVTFFQALGKTERDSADGLPAPRARNGEHDSGIGDLNNMQHMSHPPSAAQDHRRSKSTGKQGAMVYGVVMYDFKAERADELEANADDAVIVIAQSNPEWFVAKPIGRLGGPGLIPVSFVEIRDMATNTPVPNPEEYVRNAAIPKVEEWKKMAAEYKNSSISLGKFEVGGSSSSARQQQAPQSLEQQMDRLSLQQSSFESQPASHYNRSHTAASDDSLSAAPLFASIPRYCFAQDKYWFVIEVQLEDGRHWELMRYYEDFYDFQIALLSEFPDEAGSTGLQTRTLPYMPGPVNYVTDATTSGRLLNLDAYVKNLLAQPPYISRSNVVRQFFTPREGDHEVDPAALDKEYRGSDNSQQSSTNDPSQYASPNSSHTFLNNNSSSYLDGGLSAPSSQPTSSHHHSLVSASSVAPQAVKMKLWFNDECIAVRVPSDVTLQQLYDQIRKRLRFSPHESFRVTYTDAPTGSRLSLLNNNDLDYALQRNEKLSLTVELIGTESTR